MSSKAIEQSGPDYLTLANKITLAKLDVDEAKEGVSHLLPPDPAEEKHIDEMAEAEYRKQEAAHQPGGPIANYNGIRAEISSKESKVEIENEKKRKALKEATVNLNVAVEAFRSTLQIDLSNGFAVEALERIDRFAGGNIDQAAVMMIGMAKQLQNARRVKQSSSVRSGAPAPTRGFNPAKDY